MDPGAPLTGLDNVWNMMGVLSEFDPLILTCWTCRSRVPIEELRKILSETADAFPRFKERIELHDDPAHSPYFAKDPYFDIANHVNELHLPPHQRDSQGFDEVVSDFVSRLWDHAHSPWEVVVCNEYDDGTGASSAVIFRAHHSIADGQGFVRAILWATSFRPEIEKLIAGPPKKPADDHKDDDKQVSAVHRTRSAALKAYDFASTSAWTVFDAFAFGCLAVLTWWRISNLTPSSRELRWSTSVSFRNKPSASRTYTKQPRQRRFARSAPIQMSDIKKVQKAFTGRGQAFKDGQEKLTTRVAGEHVTLNDVMVAVISEAMHRAKDRARLARPPNIISKQLDRVLPDRIACFIPMSFRKPGDPTMKNRSLGGMIYVPRPTAMGDMQRSKQAIYDAIHRAKFQLAIIKQSRTPRRLADRIVDPIARSPLLFPWPLAHLPFPSAARRYITTPILNTILSSIHCVLTNVPGPAQETVKLGGKHEILSWTVAPPQGAVGTQGIGILSYAGQLSISVLADAQAGDEEDGGGVARRICDDFEEIFALYVKAADQVIRNM